MCQQELLLGLVVVALGNAQFLAEYKSNTQPLPFLFYLFITIIFIIIKSNTQPLPFIYLFIIILFYKWIGSMLFTRHY